MGKKTVLIADQSTHKRKVFNATEDVTAAWCAIGSFRIVLTKVV